MTYPGQVQTGGLPTLAGGILTLARGIPTLAGGRVPTLTRGVCTLAQGGPPPGQDRDTPLPRDRTAYGVLDTLRSVCLLRSRRRTFLFVS